MVVVPAATGVTSPVRDTVAVPGSADAHVASLVTSLVLPSANPATALPWYRLPVATAMTVSDLGVGLGLDGMSLPHDVATPAAIERHDRPMQRTKPGMADSTYRSHARAQRADSLVFPPEGACAVAGTPHSRCRIATRWALPRSELGSPFEPSVTGPFSSI